jgi:hypothetical protein
MGRYLPLINTVTSNRSLVTGNRSELANWWKPSKDGALNAFDKHATPQDRQFPATEISATASYAQKTSSENGAEVDQAINPASDIALPDLRHEIAK